ncbi:MAG: hypothetical protein J6U92_00930 [Clostridia bacterium]|nr:hypothetical protein [Clostridia bacterium]
MYSSLSDKRMSFDVGKTSGGAWLVGISTIDRYAYVWSTSGGTSGGGGTGNSSGSTWTDSMYANNATASGAIAKNIIKY